MEWLGVLVVYSWLAAMMVLGAFVLFYWLNAAAQFAKTQSHEKARSQAAAPRTATTQPVHR